MNNNNTFQKFIENVRSIRMTTQEKNDIRSRLLDFSHTTSPVPTPSPYGWFTMIKRSAALAMVVVLSVGSITNIVSGEALPGDMLYSLKITHEEIKQAVTFDPIRKTSYEIKRTEKRIQEATKLVQRERLDITQQSNIVQSIRTQVNEIEKGIQKINVSNPERALVLQTSLRDTIQQNSSALKETLELKTLSARLVHDSETSDAPAVSETDPQLDTHLIDTTQDTLESEIGDSELSLTGAHESHPASMLLESLDQEVNRIEEKQRELEAKKIEREEQKRALEIKEINKNINDLERILDIQKAVNVLKDTLQKETSHQLSEEFIELSESLEKKAQKFIHEEKYGRAEDTMTEILGLYQEYEKYIIPQEIIDIVEEPLELHDVITNDENNDIQNSEVLSNKVPHSIMQISKNKK